MKRAVCLASLVLLVATSQGIAGEWPHLRGPNLDGRLAATGALQGGLVGLELDWRAPLGSGYSGIVISGERAVTMYSDGEVDWVIALDTATGERVWRYRIAMTHKGHDGSDDGPLSSPVISEELVYALGPKGQLLALRLTDGKKVWSRTLPKDFDSAVPHFGFTTTPLVEGNVLVVQTGGPDGRAISGLDKRSGKPLWSLGDDAVDYQSPSLMDLAGRRQIVAISAKQIHGIDPLTGYPLWKHELGENDSVESANPTYAGGDRFLVFAGGDAVVLEVGKSADGYEVKELYRSKELGNTYAAPVFHGGHLYGFRRQFLTCINAETGERLWKSRPPGGRGLILVDGHLVVFGAGGNVVLVEATPDGYREKARLQALDGSGYTWPSFADGKIFVRNLETMASVSVTESATAAVGTTTASRVGSASEFDKFVQQVEAASTKAALIDEFMERHAESPIIEGDCAHFVYRGEVGEIAITGTMIASGNAEPLERIEGTDFYYRTYKLEPGGRWEYRYSINFGDEQITDPRNPNAVPATFGNQKFSEVSMPGYEAPGYLGEPSGSARGTLEEFTYKSESLGNERTVRVYLPPGYQDGSETYPLLIVHQGKDWLERGLMANSLDNLIGDRVAPIVVAFVEPRGEWWLEAGGTGTDDYVAMLAEEFVPYLEEKYRLQREAEAHVVMGTGYFGVTAAYAALKYPDVFGNVALQSVALGLGSDDALMKMIGGKREHLRFYLDWNRYELRQVDSAIDLAQDNRRLAEALTQGGYEYTGGEVLDSYGWGSWRARTDRILTTFFPID